MNTDASKLNISRENTCCFTGHRADKLPWRYDEEDVRCVQLKRRIADAVAAAYDEGFRHFICGMATGCDMYFCEAVMELRESRGDVTVEAAIPWEGQAAKWSADIRKRYFRLISECDMETVVQAAFSPDCMMRRNRYMVDNSSLLIAAYDGQSGGTQSTMLYAVRNGLRIIELTV